MKRISPWFAMLALYACRPIVIQSAAPPAQSSQAEGDAPPKPPSASGETLEANPSTEALSATETTEPPPQDAPTSKPVGSTEPKSHGDHASSQGSGKTAPDPTPTPAPESPPSDELTVRRIEVRVDGSDVGVVAEIYRLDPQNVEHWFANTAESGVVEPGKPCASSDRFDVKPKMDYLRVDPQPCATSLVFRVPIAKAVYMLTRMGDDAMSQGNPALAQHYYAAAAKRLRKIDPQASDAALVKANEAALQALGVSSKGKILDRKAIDALRRYQRESKLPVTGKLDDLTRGKISGIDDKVVMERANAAIDAKPLQGDNPTRPIDKQKSRILK